MLQGKPSSSSKNKEVTLRDFLEAVDKIKKFVDFGEKAGKLIFALSKAGVDINNINPYDFNSMLRLAMAYRGQVGIDEDIDVEELRQEFEEILDISVTEIRQCISTINRFMSVYRSATHTLKTASKHVGVSKEQLAFLGELFNLKLPTRKEEEEEEEVIEEFTEDEKEEIRKIIKKFREGEL